MPTYIAHDWWRCPNSPPCSHGGLFHDVHDFDDLRPMCCIEGCTCGKAANADAIVTAETEGPQ